MSSSMAWSVRPAEPGDAEALSALNADALAAALPPGWVQVPPRDADDRRLILVAETGEGCVDAFCLATTVLDEASLLLIVTAPSARGQGVARRLLRALLVRLADHGVDRCFLEVRETNAAAIALYRGCGFAQDGCREAYYAGVTGTQREDAILMTWTRKTDKHAGA